MEKKNIIRFTDFSFCCILLPLILLLQPLDRWVQLYPFFAFSLICFLYFLYGTIRLVNIPRLIMRRKYFTLMLILAGIVICGNILSNIPYPSDVNYVTSEAVRMNLRRRTVWLLILVVFGFGLSVDLIVELLRQIFMRRDIEIAKNKAENALYKAQIDPHFMFNTLNSLYGLVVSKSDKAEAAFVKFTEILKYMYRHATVETITLGQELEYIRNYIDLQSLRLNSHTKIQFDVDVDNPSLPIPPMILITFIENAFKYGSSPGSDCEINISLSLKDNLLTLNTRNNVMYTNTKSNNKIGLENCRSRLELLFPDRFTLDISNDSQIYIVQLQIRL